MREKESTTMACEHSSWFWVTENSQRITLNESDRFQCIGQDVSPNLITLVGIEEKSILSLFRAPKPPKEAEVHLNRTILLPKVEPVLVASAPKPNVRPSTLGYDDCHLIRERVTPHQDHITAFQAVASHILLPFSDVICYSAGDLASLEQVVSGLQELLLSNQARGNINTEIIVFYPSGEDNASELRRKVILDFHAKTSRLLLDVVGNVHILSSAVARHTQKLRVFAILENARQRRCDSKQLFSMEHFKALLACASDHICTRPDHRFNKIEAARAQYPVARDLAKHLSYFISHFRTSEDLVSVGVPLIASSFMLDNYPPGSHRFEPKDVFGLLYRKPLVESGGRTIAFPQSNDVLAQGRFVDLVERSFQDLFYLHLSDCSVPVAELHLGLLHKYRERISEVYDRRTCLVCLRRRPQYRLPCKHFMCQNCIMTFGKESVKDRTMFNLSGCLVCCDAGGLQTFRIHPPTAGAAILSIDGGGARGIIPLTFLQLLEREIDLPIPLQRFFKFSLGISSGVMTSLLLVSTVIELTCPGALIVLALFSNGWSIKKSTARFEKLAKLAFKRRSMLKLPLFSRFQEGIVSWFQDSLYPATHIEDALLEAFGDKDILDCSYATKEGIKIGLPVATVEEESVCLFTNYNGIGDRDVTEQGREAKTEYHAIGPESIHGEDVKVWEVARAATAAVGFFPTKEIRGVGTFQDAGPLINDPCVAATSEMTAVLPNAKSPDFILSIGTGLAQAHVRAPSKMTPEVGIFSGWKQRALPRLYRMLCRRMNDRPIKQILHDNPRYYRWDVQFMGKEPRLDNVSSIEKLKQCVKPNISTTPSVGFVARHAIASLFYFELEEEPSRYDGQEAFTGLIRCAISKEDLAFRPLLSRLRDKSAVFYVGNDVLPIKEDYCVTSEGFLTKVQFRASGQFSVLIQELDGDRYHISGSPFTVEGLAQAQRFSSPFGRSDHRAKRQREDSGECVARKKRRLEQTS